MYSPMINYLLFEAYMTTFQAWISTSGYNFESMSTRKNIRALRARARCVSFLQTTEKRIPHAPKIEEGLRCEVHKTQLLRFAIFPHPLRVLGARRRRNSLLAIFVFVTAENEPAKHFERRTTTVKEKC